MKTSPAPAKTTKTIVLVGGDKGGVGKSAIARTLIEYYQDKKVAALAYDADDANPSLTRYYPEATRLNTKAALGFDPLINGLEHEAPVQLVDMGAGTSLMLSAFEQEVKFIACANQYGAKVTFVFVLAPATESINLLRNLADQYHARIGYVIAKSNIIPGTWDLWDNSKTKARVLGELGGIEISIPKLNGEVISLIDRKALHWSAIMGDKEQPLATRTRVGAWVTDTYAEFDKAFSYLA